MGNVAKILFKFLMSTCQKHYIDISSNIKTVCFYSTELQGTEMASSGIGIKVNSILIQFSYRKLKGTDIRVQ